MIFLGNCVCPKCNGALKHYDTIRRTVLTKGREKRRVYVRRLRCTACGSLHNELPDYILPFYHYERELIDGVVERLITSNTLGYENYPCEATMRKWLIRFNPHVSNSD